jgi:hypothetical protein
MARKPELDNFSYPYAVLEILKESGLASKEASRPILALLGEVKRGYHDKAFQHSIPVYRAKSKAGYIELTCKPHSTRKRDLVRRRGHSKHFYLRAELIECEAKFAWCYYGQRNLHHQNIHELIVFQFKVKHFLTRFQALIKSHNIYHYYLCRHEPPEPSFPDKLAYYESASRIHHHYTLKTLRTELLASGLKATGKKAVLVERCVLLGQEKGDALITAKYLEWKRLRQHYPLNNHIKFGPFSV